MKSFLSCFCHNQENALIQSFNLRIQKSRNKNITGHLLPIEDVFLQSSYKNLVLKTKINQFKGTPVFLWMILLLMFNVYGNTVIKVFILC